MSARESGERREQVFEFLRSGVLRLDGVARVATGQLDGLDGALGRVVAVVSEPDGEYLTGATDPVETVDDHALVGGGGVVEERQNLVVEEAGIDESPVRYRGVQDRLERLAVAVDGPAGAVRLSPGQETAHAGDVVASHERDPVVEGVGVARRAVPPRTAGAVDDVLVGGSGGEPVGSSARFLVLDFWHRRYIVSDTPHS